MSTIFENLVRLKAEGNGVVFMCGVLHVGKLIAKFEQASRQDEVVYYFPRSSKDYDDGCDEAKVLDCEALKGHVHVVSVGDIPALKGKVMADIASKMKYATEVLESNSHSRFLSEFFSCNFKARERVGHYVDALLDVEEARDVKDIEQRLKAVGVRSRCVSLEGRTCLVVPNVNTKPVADDIRKLKP